MTVVCTTFCQKSCRSFACQSPASWSVTGIFCLDEGTGITKIRSDNHFAFSTGFVIGVGA